MYKIYSYKADDSMSDLICNNIELLFVLNRFNIPLGFEEKTIEDACKENDVHTGTFLNIINLLISDEEYPCECKEISIPSLLKYLKESHKYFLDFSLPLIKDKLKVVIDSNNKISNLIIKSYDEYIAEINEHMMYEEKNVFPYIEMLTKKDTQKLHYNIDIFNKRHDKIDIKLTELKNIIIKFYHSKESNNISKVLFDIFTSAQDLASHNKIEDKILIPAVRLLESKKD